MTPISRDTHTHLVCFSPGVCVCDVQLYFHATRQSAGLWAGNGAGRQMDVPPPDEIDPALFSAAPPLWRISDMNGGKNEEGGTAALSE